MKNPLGLHQCQLPSAIFQTDQQASATIRARPDRALPNAIATTDDRPAACTAIGCGIALAVLTRGTPKMMMPKPAGALTKPRRDGGSPLGVEVRQAYSVGLRHRGKAGEEPEP
jgi:hypothetical protein